jgi:hypothetical protein
MPPGVEPLGERGVLDQHARLDVAVLSPSVKLAEVISAHAGRSPRYHWAHIRFLGQGQEEGVRNATEVIHAL